jgi:glycosyltransferase involved in cell wall biosynthesis
MPEVSVIVTTNNRKEYLSMAIEAILNQTYKDFELIVVDNFSDYDFFALIDSFKNTKIVPFQNHNHGIIAINRNYGLKHAKGKYVAFCDDDDIWIENKLHVQMDIINKTNCDLVSSNMFYFKGDILNLIRKKSNKKINNINDLIKYNHINTSSVLVRNKDLKFSEDPNLVAVEDYALWLNLCVKGFRFEFIQKPLVYLRISEASSFKKNWDTNHLKLIYLYISFLLQNPELHIKIKILYKILWNFLKYSVKNEIRN